MPTMCQARDNVSEQNKGKKPYLHEAYILLGDSKHHRANCVAFQKVISVTEKKSR